MALHVCVHSLCHCCLLIPMGPPHRTRSLNLSPLPSPLLLPSSLHPPPHTGFLHLAHTQKMVRTEFCQPFCCSGNPGFGSGALTTLYLPCQSIYMCQQLHLSLLAFLTPFMSCPSAHSPILMVRISTPNSHECIDKRVHCFTSKCGVGHAH